MNAKPKVAHAINGIMNANYGTRIEKMAQNKLFNANVFLLAEWHEYRHAYN